jgi:hypothetical protein
MMKKFLAVFGFSAVMISASVSQAIYFEPYLGLYGTGSGTMTTPSAATQDLTATLGYGLRLGYGFMGFSAGVDYEMGKIDSKASGTTTKVDTTNLGVFGSFDVPVLPVRAYLTYFIDAKSKTEAGVESKGKGFKLGVGFTGLPFVVINIDYYSIKNDTMGGATTDQDIKMTVLSVSLPLNF